MADQIDDPEDLPSTAGEFADDYPDVWAQYAGLGEACSNAGPIDDETKRLVKLALAIGPDRRAPFTLTSGAASRRVSTPKR